ncbi:Putative membrane insertion efficiency factor [Gossypium arboreum]|uniref:Putative membrane insertion efficiency factor n=1 Tax=Gossypium arboreum TaxID=29729 RepID=A0A0B0PQS3_GOSAR|nr:Putative membrane insertion efficiency factor [Gossypium arboreum]
MKIQSLSNSDQVIQHKDRRPVAKFTFHQPCNANERISFTHVLGYEFHCCEWCYILQKSYTQRTNFWFLIYLNLGFYLHQSVRVTYTSPPSTQGLVMSHYEHHK